MANLDLKESTDVLIILLGLKYQTLYNCLQVRWDNMDAIRCNRICPWEIESCGSFPDSNGLMLLGSKRTRFGVPPICPEYPVPSRFTILCFLNSCQVPVPSHVRNMFYSDD